MRLSKSSFRKVLLAGTALILEAAPIAFACAEVGDAAPAADIQEVEVTGAREAQRKAIDAKLGASGIVDSITQDDIGRLPDTTVVEAARRIPGLSVDLLTDNTRGRSEVQRASIRGFDAKYNTVSIDGSQISSIDSAALTNGLATRAQSLNLLPASLINQMDVHKTISADMNPNALGGDIDLITFSALKTKDVFTGDISAFGGIDTTSGTSTTGTEPSGRASLLLANRWEGRESKIGIVFSADYQHTTSASNGITDNVPGAGNSTGDGWIYYGTNGKAVNYPNQTPNSAVPARLDVYSFDTDLIHYSYSGKIEYESSNGLQSSLFAGYYKQDSQETRNEVLTTDIVTAPGVLSPTTGVFAKSDGEIGISRQPLTQGTEFFNWKTSYDLGNRLILNFGSAYSVSDAELYRNMVKYDTGGTSTQVPGMSYGYDIAGYTPQITLQNPSYYNNLNNFLGDYWRFITTYETNQVIDIHPGLSWNAGSADAGFGGKIGIGWVKNDMDYEQNYLQYTPKNPSQYLLTGAALTGTGLTIPSWGGAPFNLINLPAADALFNNNMAAFRQLDELASGPGVDYRVNEQTESVYLMGIYTSDALRGEAGLRLERTMDQLGSYTETSPDVYRWGETGSAYNAALPSAQVKYSIVDELVAHAGFSETLGRPDYSAYAPLSALKTVPTTPISGAITLGNPQIEPRRTNNYDLSADYYFDNFKSLFSAAFFHKDLKNEFYNITYVAPYLFNGATYQSTFTQTRNGATASVNGGEFNLQIDDLHILPTAYGTVGLGMNYTVLGTRFNIYDVTGAPRSLHNLVNQPDDMFNLSMFYNLGDFSTTISYNHQGTALYSTGRYAWEDTYIKARQQLDLSMRYQIAPDMTAILEASNITREPFVSQTGPDRNLLGDSYAIGATLWFGANYKF